MQAHCVRAFTRTGHLSRSEQEAGVGFLCPLFSSVSYYTICSISTHSGGRSTAFVLRFHDKDHNSRLSKLLGPKLDRFSMRIAGGHAHSRPAEVHNLQHKTFD
jgi:hypothetical protein